MKRIVLDPLVSDILHSYTGSHRPAPEVTVERPLLNVVGHEPSLVQCLSNLVSNALKFVPADSAPRLRIWTERKEKNVRLWVEDNGIGIPPDQQERVFKMFERSAEASTYSGTGVGLAIVKKAIQRMHGEVGVVSEAGKGSRFWIELPLAEPS